MLANGYKINESDKCIYSKFHNNKAIIICLYVDDMLIFDTDLEQVEETEIFAKQFCNERYGCRRHNIRN